MEAFVKAYEGEGWEDLAFDVTFKTNVRRDLEP